MGWNIDEPKTTKKGMETSTKILFAIIACVALIIILIIILLVNIEISTFTIAVNHQISSTTNKNLILTEIDNVTYLNIEEFAKLVKYEYHEGEYKAFTIEKDKCYVQGINETATFYLNDNKVCKLPVNKLDEEYREFTFENTIKEVNGKMYAPIDVIQLAFNVYIEKDNKSISIYTLDELVKMYGDKVKGWGYTGFLDQSFENQKSLLYGYLIVKKENGLYKIIDNDNTKEIVSDRYTSIQFNESAKEFWVTNSLGQIGIINLDGTTKIDPIYESISIYNNEYNLYLVQKDLKYGIVKSGNITIISPEYDTIGLTFNSEKIYKILDTLIPACKDGKWGAIDREGKEVIKAEYDGFGCDITTVTIGEIQKEVKPVLTIEKCNGIVVKIDNKYGIIDVNGQELVQTQVDSIYELVNPESEDERYYMLYNNKELNIIEKLVEVGLLEKQTDSNTSTNNNNQLENNSITVDINKDVNTVSSNVVQ